MHSLADADAMVTEVDIGFVDAVGSVDEHESVTGMMVDD